MDVIDNIISYCPYSPYYVTSTSANGSVVYWSCLISVCKYGPRSRTRQEPVKKNKNNSSPKHVTCENSVCLRLPNSSSDFCITSNLDRNTASNSIFQTLYFCNLMLNINSEAEFTEI